MRFNGADDNIKANQSTETVALASKTTVHHPEKDDTNFQPLYADRTHSPELEATAIVTTFGFSSKSKPKVDTQFSYIQHLLVDPSNFKIVSTTSKRLRVEPTSKKRQMDDIGKDPRQECLAAIEAIVKCRQIVTEFSDRLSFNITKDLVAQANQLLGDLKPNGAGE
jgi:hypothetical protein